MIDRPIEGDRESRPPGAADPAGDTLTSVPVAADEREESPVRFGVLMAIGVTLLFQFGAQLAVRRLGAVSLPVLTALSQLLLMLAPAVYAARAQELPVRELFRLRKTTPGMHVAVVLGIVMLWPIVQSYLILQDLYLIPEGLYDAYRDMQQRLEALYERLLPVGGALTPVLAIIAGALVPAVCEEAVFRGAAQRSFERRMRPLVAITLSSLLFAALHLQPHNLVPLTLLGMFLGLASWSSGSVYPAIVGHFLFNAVMIGALYTMRASGERPGTHSEEDLITLLPGVLICIVGLVLIVRWLMLHGRGREAATIMADATIAVEPQPPITDTPPTSDER